MQHQSKDCEVCDKQLSKSSTENPGASKSGEGFIRNKIVQRCTIPEVVHQGLTCNGCNITPIKGNRYICLTCLNLNLCEKCGESKNHEHNLILTSSKHKFMVYFCFRISMMLTISDSQPPPTKLRLQLSREASVQQSEAGVYSLQSSLVNGFPFWKHDSSEYAIWMYGGWYIGGDEYIGTDFASITGPFGIEEWPNNISSKWKFHAGGGKWQEAESGDIVFQDCSPKGNFAFS